MTTIIMILTIALITVHISACAAGKQKIKTFTKPFLVPSLALSFFSALTESGLTLPLWPAVMSALVLYALGDILLIGHKKKRTVWGALSFALGHVVWCALFTSGGMSFPATLVSVVLWALFFAFFVSPHIGGSKSRLAYACMVMIFGVLTGGSLFDGNIWARVPAIIGTALFGLSDSLLLYEMKKKTDMHSLVMLSYMSAVALFLVSAFQMAY